MRWGLAWHNVGVPILPARTVEEDLPLQNVERASAAHRGWSAVLHFCFPASFHRIEWCWRMHRRSDLDRSDPAGLTYRLEIRTCVNHVDDGQRAGDLPLISKICWHCCPLLRVPLTQLYHQHFLSCRPGLARRSGAALFGDSSC